MRVQVRLVILMSLVLTVSIAAFTILRDFEYRKLSAIFADRMNNEIEIFDKILELKGKSLETLAFDYTYWDEMVNFIVTDNQAWAQELIDESVLSNYRADAVWVYKTDLSLAYSINSPKDPDLKDIPLEKDALKNLFLKHRLCHFFINTPSGLMEVRGATVHPTADTQRKTPPQGYFFTGRFWDKDYINELQLVTGSTIVIAPLAKEEPAARLNPKEGIIAFSKILNGWDKEPLVRLDVNIAVESIRYFNRASNQEFSLLLIFAVISIVFISFSLAHWVGVPLRMISQTLSMENKAHLNNLLKENTEFGDISRLIDKFFGQKEQLANEVAERKKTEEALRVTEERYRLQFEGALDGIFLADAETGILVDCNAAALKLVGREKSEIIGQHQRILHPPETVEKGFSKTFREHLKDKHGLTLEERVVTKNGEIRYVAIKANLIEVGGEKILQGIFHDITERKQAEEELRLAYDKLKQTQAQLIQASKMSGLGSLASGVAHEINNPLTGVLNNVQLIKMSIAENKNINPDDFKELLDSMEESAQRCVNITRALLDFGRPSKGVFQNISVKELIGRVLILIRHQLEMGNIKIERNIESNLPEIKCDPQLLQQAIFDIISNARWAIQKKSKEEGGVIGIKACYDPDKDTVDIRISDTGIGIPAENLKRCFEPFFTTKHVGEGSGLGLFMVYNIIKEHKGNIDVESQLNEGATFRISLPVG